ncbi:ATP-binding cassette domain-containing protein [Thomasclavelia sp.]|uniref:ABC transporter ATP-binding protein/permease n=1 Tax=Thomasclavelia sp. TaxID=3025757 RepID=UPI0026319401|nr:ATP-binding cassette domain-containing protein [Thomasclavelia sp.]
MLEIKKLSKRYDDIIIDNLSICFPSTGMVVIVGKSGCGKTTLLNILGGIDQEYDGEILFDQQNIKTIKNYCRKHVGFIFQNFNLINWLNTKENYILPKFFGNIIFKREIDDRREKLELTSFLKKRPALLSGGQKQRVAMLRAMIKNVDILLCDEPTGSLDDENAEMIFELLKQEAKERLVIVITHNKQLAYRYADQIFTFQNGKLLGKYRRDKSDNFYCRLKEKKNPFDMCKLVLMQYRANFFRNTKIVTGVVMALLCIMITFTLSDSLTKQIQKQLSNIFPSQLVSLQTRNDIPLKYQDLVDLKNNKDITYLYGEMKDYEFMGVSLQKNYQSDKTVYISDMTKELKNNKLEKGREIRNDNEIVLSKTTAIHLNKDYQQLLNKEVYGYYLHGDIIKRVILKVVGISNETTVFDTIYINELANVKQVSEVFNQDINELVFSIGMINIDNQVNVDDSLEKLRKENKKFEFKVAGDDISARIDSFLLQVHRVLILFSLLAIVSACFLIGEVLYLSVVEKTKDIGIFRCLGASKLQLRLLVLLECFMVITIAYLLSYLIFNRLVNLINEIVEMGLQLKLSEVFIQIDNKLLMIIYIGALLFGLLSSCFPAYYASRLDPVKSLKYQRY